MDVRLNTARGTDSAVERQVSTDSALRAMERATCHASICALASLKHREPEETPTVTASTPRFDLRECMPRRQALIQLPVRLLIRRNYPVIMPLPKKRLPK